MKQEKQEQQEQREVIELDDDDDDAFWSSLSIKSEPLGPLVAACMLLYSCQLVLAGQAMVLLTTVCYNKQTCSRP